MSREIAGVRVTLTPDGCYPQSLRWRARTVRVLQVEQIRTFGLERRYCVRTLEGQYELGLHLGTGAWQVRQHPSWFGRAWARFQRLPRYTLPAGQRRSGWAAVAPQRVSPAAPSGGGTHAIRLALVRQ